MKNNPSSSSTETPEIGRHLLASTFVDQITLKHLLETLDHVVIETVPQAVYQQNKVNGQFLKNTDTATAGGAWTLQLPDPLPIGELLFLIPYLQKRFDLDQSTSQDSILSKLKILIGYIVKSTKKQDTLSQVASSNPILPKIKILLGYILGSTGKQNNPEKQKAKIDTLLHDIADTYQIDAAFIEKIKNHPITANADTKAFIHALNPNSKKIGFIVSRGTVALTQTLKTELDTIFFQKGRSLLRYGMETITQAEQLAVIKKGDNPLDTIGIRVETDQLDESTQLLREKIGIDVWKSKLSVAREVGDKKEIATLELEATNAIIKTLFEYPYQFTEDNNGYQPFKIFITKEIYCLGFSLLGHAFLSELQIYHEGVSISDHSALSVTIGEKGYYFDATMTDHVVVYMRDNSDNNGVYYDIKLKGGSHKIRVYLGNSETILLAQIYNNKGISLARLGRYNEAIQCYDAAIRVDSKDIAAYINKGSVLAQSSSWMPGIHSEALGCFNIAIGLDPKNITPYINKGNTLLTLGKYDEVIECCDIAIGLNPQNTDAYNNKCLALLTLGKYDEVIECCNIAIGLDPENTDAYNNKCIALRALGKHDETNNVKLI